jgi:hypothetical protein
MTICLVDTSVFCELLEIPKVCADPQAMALALTRKVELNEHLVLPMATIIETGNHIGQNGDGRQRRRAAKRFVDLVGEAIRGGGSPFVAARFVEKAELLRCVFGEWLYRVHSVRYDRLPDLLVVIDWFAEDGFLDSAARNARAEAMHLSVPPLVYSGIVRSQTHLEGLVRVSTYGSELVEGFVLRREHAGRLVSRAKWARPGFVQKRDADWDFLANTVAPEAARPPRQMNQQRLAKPNGR